MAHNALAQDTKPRLAGFTVRVKVVGHKKEVFIFLTKPVKFQSLILLSSVNDSFYYHMFLLMIAACFFLLKYTKQVDFWSKTHFGLCSYRLGKTCKINSLLSDCECEKSWSTSELSFAESLPESGAGEYDFLLHLKFIGIIS